MTVTLLYFFKKVFKKLVLNKYNNKNPSMLAKGGKHIVYIEEKDKYVNMSL